MTNESTNKKETRKLSGSITRKTAAFSSPRFKKYVKDNEAGILDRIYKACIHEDRDSKDYIAYAESVLIDQEMEDHFGWFEDIAGTVYGIILEYRTVFDSIKNEKSQMQTGGFDIYSWAQQFPGADYFDQHTGYVYRCADYTRAIRFGLPTPGIAVVDSMTGQLIGYAVKEN